MKLSELLSRILLVSAVFAAVGIPLLFWTRTPLIHARLAEHGGWSPDILKAEIGKPLRLRLTSDDVVHGFAVGQMEMDAVDVEPGKVTEIELIFDKPGIYTFFCTRWCGLNHWRMRGTIEVSDPSSNAQSLETVVNEDELPPLYVSLGLDIDAPHEAALIPDTQPSALRGRQLAVDSDVYRFIQSDFYRANSPYQVFEELSSTGLSNSEKWDLVAYIWQSNTTPDALADVKQLYAQNCAACHGETGAGDGVFADDLVRAGDMSVQAMAGAQEMAMQQPADFTDPKRILGASPALLEGKILRGGMGTGMPMWGSVFTEEQIRDLVAYLYSFQFDYPKQGESR